MTVVAPSASRPTKILLVDEDEMIRIFFRDIFWVHGGEENYTVETAQTLKEAKEILEVKGEIPDIIFLDLMLPFEKGEKSSSGQIGRSIEFLKGLRGDPRFSKIKIVVFSGHRDKTLQKDLLDLGVNGYLVKGDFMPKEIIQFADSIK